MDTPHTFSEKGARRIVDAVRAMESMPGNLPPVPGGFQRHSGFTLIQLTAEISHPLWTGTEMTLSPSGAPTAVSYGGRSWDASKPVVVLGDAPEVGTIVAAFPAAGFYIGIQSGGAGGGDQPINPNQLIPCNCIIKTPSTVYTGSPPTQPDYPQFTLTLDAACMAAIGVCSPASVLMEVFDLCTGTPIVSGVQPLVVPAHAAFNTGVFACEYQVIKKTRVIRMWPSGTAGVGLSFDCLWNLDMDDVMTYADGAASGYLATATWTGTADFVYIGDKVFTKGATMKLAVGALDEPSVFFEWLSTTDLGGIEIFKFYLPCMNGKMLKSCSGIEVSPGFSAIPGFSGGPSLNCPTTTPRSLPAFSLTFTLPSAGTVTLTVVPA